MRQISPEEVALAFEKRRRLRPAVVPLEVDAEELRLKVLRILFPNTVR